MDDEAMARLEGGLAAAVQAAAASKPNSKERKHQMLNFKLRCAMARGQNCSGTASFTTANILHQTLPLGVLSPSGRASSAEVCLTLCCCTVRLYNANCH